MDRWTQIELFVQVADLGNLSRAAEKLGLSNAAASRHLRGLEERLGARLVERTTRRMWLTDAGRSYHQRCSAMLAEMAEAEFLCGLMRDLVSRTSLITAAFRDSNMHNCGPDEHEEILLHLKRGDLAAAQTAMAEHLQHVESELNLRADRDQPKSLRDALV